MTQGFRPIPVDLKSGLVEVAPNIWTIEAKECVCYRPPMQPRYPYIYRAIIAVQCGIPALTNQKYGLTGLC